jgi:hypothetical protein
VDKVGNGLVGVKLVTSGLNMMFWAQFITSFLVLIFGPNFASSSCQKDKYFSYTRYPVLT